jgi:hypothetical protein
MPRVATCSAPPTDAQARNIRKQGKQARALLLYMDKSQDPAFRTTATTQATLESISKRAAQNPLKCSSHLRDTDRWSQMIQENAQDLNNYMSLFESRVQALRQAKREILSAGDDK